MRIAAIVAALVIGFTLFAAVKYSRAGYESASYEVELSDGDFEIRRYPPTTLVSTPMETSGEQDGSFMRLFRYISGDNEEGQKISMTTPVFEFEDRARMSFVLPRAVVEAGAPVATHGEVSIETLEDGRFAVYRFSGEYRPGEFEEPKRKLREWVARRGLATRGQPIVAGYDPPFTPPFLRRNEILLRLAD